jgi:hypothetical protein
VGHAEARVSTPAWPSEKAIGLPLPASVQALALLRRALGALPNPSEGRELVLDAVRLLEAQEDAPGAVEAG